MSSPLDSRSLPRMGLDCGYEMEFTFSDYFLISIQQNESSPLERQYCANVPLLIHKS